MKNIMPVFGTRPEAIKMAPVIRELEKRDGFKTTVTVTGQHKEMLYQVLDLFCINVNRDLEIMKPGQTLSQITTRVLMGLDELFIKEKPQMVLVHGDTTTTFAASLAAFYHKIPVGHVEAGLRSFNKYEPFPEELNRGLTGLLADLHFSPTKRAKNNLLKENKPESSIYVTGNTVIDAVLMVADMVDDVRIPGLECLNSGSRILLVEAHRRENLGEPMERMCQAVLDSMDKCDDMEVVFPVHKNPLVRETVYKYLSNNNRIHLIEPPAYDKFVFLMKRAHVVLTDSGGLQEEAPSLGKPVLVLRDVTERPEAIDFGTAKLVGTDRNKIMTEITNLFNDQDCYEKMSCANNPYGDGRAAKKIVDIIDSFL